LEPYFRRQRQTDEIVELRDEIGQLQLRRQQLLPGLQTVGPALDQLSIDRAAVLHLLYSLAPQLLRGAELRLDRAPARFVDEDGVIDLVDLQHDRIFDAAPVRDAALRIGKRGVVGSLDFQQLRQRLRDADAERR